MARAAALLLCVVWALSPIAVGAPQAQPAPGPAIARMDELWATRDDTGAMQDAVRAGNELIAADPTNYEAEWRLARAYWWLALTQRDRLGRKALAVRAMEWAERARNHRPERVEGHYFMAISVGEYGATIGVMQALVDGIAGKVESAALRANEIDSDYAVGAPGIVLGRYYFMLPWPKRDLHRSQRYLENVVRRHPGKLIAHQFLAETYYALGERDQAHGQLLLVLTTAPAPDTERDLPAPKPLAEASLREWFGGH